MYKKLSFVLIAGLICLLVLQLLEVSNLKLDSSNFTQQVNIVQYMIYASIMFALALIVLSFWSTPTKKTISQVKPLEEEGESINQSEESTTIHNTSEYENKIKNIEHKLMSLLSKSNSIDEICTKFLSLICNDLKLAQGIIFVRKSDSDEFYVKGTYAYYNENTGYSFRIGEGIGGQVAKNQKAITLTNIPDNYINIVSGLGLGSPRYLQIIPVIFGADVIAVLEIASFTNDLLQTNDLDANLFKQLSNSLNDIR